MCGIIDSITAFDGLVDLVNPESKEIELCNNLEIISSALAQMNDTFLRMGEGTTPDTYYKVRKWIMFFENIYYLGVVELDGPQSFRGQTGAQDSAIKALDAFLGIKHKENELTEHLKAMYDYMPEGHRNFINEVRQRSRLRDYIINHAQKRRLVDAYNRCVRMLYNFRSTHYDHAYRYISQQTNNPLGTGKTHFLKWLEEIRNETLRHLIG